LLPYITDIVKFRDVVVVWCGQTTTRFVTVQNSQFSIHIIYLQTMQMDIFVEFALVV